MTEPTSAACYLFTRDAVREVDRRAMEQFGIPGVVLMENAGRQVADHAAAMRGDRDLPVLIIAGGGNNGGDGFVAARHLHNRGVEVIVHVTKPDEAYNGGAAANLNIARRMGLALTETIDNGEWSLVIDGLLGTGLTSVVRGDAAKLIEYMNAQRAPVLAVDLPSGLDCDTGKPLGCAVRATRTVTFVGWKRGFVEPGAVDYTGDIVVADIGAPRSLIESLGDMDPRIRR